MIARYELGTKDVATAAVSLYSKIFIKRKIHSRHSEFPLCFIWKLPPTTGCKAAIDTKPFHPRTFERKVNQRILEKPNLALNFLILPGITSAEISIYVLAPGQGRVSSRRSFTPRESTLPDLFAPVRFRIRPAPIH